MTTPPTPIMPPERLASPRAVAVLAAVRAQVPGLDHLPDDRVIALAYAIVGTVLDHGTGVGGDLVLDLAVAHGLDRDDIDLLAGAAATFLATPAMLERADAIAALFTDEAPR